MQEGLWHETGRRCFSSVQDFWDAEDLEGQAASVWKGNFQGKLQKGLADDGKLREFRREDMERRIRTRYANRSAFTKSRPKVEPGKTATSASSHGTILSVYG